MFEQWWQADGKSYDCATEDVAGIDIHKSLAEAAYEAGKRVGSAVGGNYTTDQYPYPTEINFANGHRVKLRADQDGRYYLSVGRW